MTLGWSISALLHGLVLAVVAVFNLYMTSPRVTPQKEPFRWDVSLMAAPRSQVVVADGAQSQEPFQAVETYPEKTGERNAQPSAQSVALPEQAEIVQMVSSPNRTYQRRPALEKSAKKTEGFNRATAMFVPGPVASVLPPLDVESQTDSKLVQIKTEVENPPVLQRPQSVTRMISNKAVLPDYGWLMDTLRTKLELVKTYPALAKAKHWQGRVVVQVSIERHGRIVNPEIEESSGNPVLDRAALEALQAASPLTLAHGLEGGHVVMLVPLNYQLE
jgi:TonB family protein